MKITIVTCVKNEGPFLLEWIAFNRMIGVTDFLFYSNDCTDGTSELLDKLSEHGVVQHLPNPGKEGQPYQMVALKHAPALPIVSNADWVFVTDVDEFLNISIGNGTLPELIEECGNPQAISITMRMFANGGVADFVDEPVISQFTKTHAPDLWGNERAIEVKTLTRNDFPLGHFGAHRPFISRHHDLSNSPVKWSDGSGRQVPYPFLTAANKRRRHRFPAKGARALASLNHYTLRSLDSYLVKSARGDVNRKYRHFNIDYWMDRNADDVEETSILKAQTKLEKEMEFLLDLPKIRELHDKTVTAHRQEHEMLLQSTDFQELRDSLINVSPALGSLGNS